MYIQRNTKKNKNGTEYKSFLLCEKYREGKNVKTHVVANLTHFPPELILTIENTLKSKTEAVVLEKDIIVDKCIDYGYLFVVLSLMKRLRIDEVLEKTLPVKIVPLVKAMIIGKLITKGSKLGIYNWLERERFIGEHLGINLKKLKVDDLYAALAQLNLSKQITEKKWVQYHKPKAAQIYLYDITSVYFEGTENELSAFGYNRDGKKGKMQICIGLVTDNEGFPLKIEVFEGNTVDSETVNKQLLALKNAFNVEDIIFVGDRGMRIMYNLDNEEELSRFDMKFITGLTKNEIKQLMEQKVIEMRLFDSKLVEIEDNEKRYVLSVNPELEKSQMQYLAHQKKRTEDLLKSIEERWKDRKMKNLENKLALVQGKSKNKKLKTEFSQKDIDSFKRRVNSVFNQTHANGYFSIENIDNEKFKINFNEEKYAIDMQLCGKYIICSNVKKSVLGTEEIRKEYKKLQHVEHNFRDFKGNDICIRPVYHRNEAQTRGHVDICFFALVVIKELETNLFNVLKTYNSEHKTQLSFDDLIAEMNKIKLCELNIGNKNKTLKFAKLNEIQELIFKILKLDPNDMIRQQKTTL
jgi:transposase